MGLVDALKEQLANNHERVLAEVLTWSDAMKETVWKEEKSWLVGAIPSDNAEIAQKLCGRLATVVSALLRSAQQSMQVWSCSLLTIVVFTIALVVYQDGALSEIPGTSPDELDDIVSEVKNAATASTEVCIAAD